MRALTLVVAGLLVVGRATAQTPGWIGIYLADASRVEVAEVVPGSPAESVGLAVGDEILSVGGVATPSVERFVSAIAGREAGDTVELVVARDGGNETLEIVLVARPEAERGPVDRDRRGHPAAPGGERASPLDAARAAARRRGVPVLVICSIAEFGIESALRRAVAASDLEPWLRDYEVVWVDVRDQPEFVACGSESPLPSLFVERPGGGWRCLGG